MKKINRERPKEVPKNVNNYHYPQPSPSNAVVNNDDIQKYSNKCFEIAKGYKTSQIKRE